MRVTIVTLNDTEFLSSTYLMYFKCSRSIFFVKNGSNRCSTSYVIFWRFEYEFFAHVFFHSELSRFWPAEGKENWKRKVTDWTLESRYQKHTSIHGKQYSRNSRPPDHKNSAFYSLIILIYFSTYWLQFFYQFIIKLQNDLKDNGFSRDLYTL